MDKRFTSNGMSHTRFYYVYKSMMNRCYRPGVKSYERYGGRGITVDKRWHTFSNFYQDMHALYVQHLSDNPGPRNTSLDRKDNRLGYSRENCRWATSREQSLNRSMPVIARNAHLTARQVVNILHCKGSVTALRLAQLYGVSDVTIGDIWRRKTWHPLPVGEDLYR